MNITDCKNQQEAIAPLWLPHIHTKHFSRKKVLCYSGFLSGHPGLKHSSVTNINDRWETARAGPWKSQESISLQRRAQKMAWKLPIPINDRSLFFSRWRETLEPMGLVKAPCTDSEHTGPCLKQPWTKFVRRMWQTRHKHYCIQWQAPFCLWLWRLPEFPNAHGLCQILLYSIDSSVQ